MAKDAKGHGSDSRGAHASGIESVGHPEPPTPVLYKKYSAAQGGGVYAAFPTLPGTMDPHTMQTFEHVGQHGTGDQSFVAKSKSAKPEEYADLHSELKSIGYNPQPIKRMSYSHYQQRVGALNAGH